MTASRFPMLIGQIEREFGVSIPVSPATDVTGIPQPLRPLYAFSDGLDLPFANIYRIADCDRARHPDWIGFGSDNYSSYFLCHVSESPALVTWDHETGHEIEAEFDTAIDWLTEELEAFIDADTNDNSVHVTKIPKDVLITSAIMEIKRISDNSSSELIRKLKSGPFSISNVVRSEAFAVVRSLHDLGISCHVECDT